MIRRILENSEYRRVLDNIFSLTGIQMLQYLIPLITFPYLTRVLGPSKFGKIAFATAFIAYLNFLTEYGFNYSAPRDISIHRDNEEEISEIYNSIMVAKIILMFISFFILLVIVFSINIFKTDYWLYFITFGIVLGNVLFPVWFFQGIEKMRYITILRILSSTIATIFIFIFVKGSNDYIYVPLINSLALITVGAYSQIIISRKFRVKFIKPSLNKIKKQLTDGWFLFISSISISVCTISNRFVLGLFVSSEVVAYYSVAEEITKAFQSLLNSVSQAMYPYFSRIQSKNKERAKYEFKKIIIIMSFLSLFLSIFLIFSAPFIINIFAGRRYAVSVSLLQILSLILLPAGISTIMGLQGLLAFGRAEEFGKIYFTASVIHLVLLFVFIYFLSVKGPAIAFVITNFIILSLIYNSLKNQRIL
ncbi:flippase [Methanothermobacter marburgensis]|uniref:Predicted polysaccharide biosynthesis protein n=1 Tax=Methanothermobacter marburgensis (strain ATCC BAA-927 / DSM 2133 / JCM 14651 / NBRC 100331 / OCM 82 / Marburg) TaxID=79929 RepID=D9PVW9_METTM|nr:flippase [Methanothermobacter marburgensis]ADL58367.1 predicted polysaccharide biosynthesis protein [Methanothermobacter marburgensis str. Marburg]WBF10515.1 flippase [Methanothermobacter marburgensis]